VKWHSKDVAATQLENAMDFLMRPVRIGNVFEDIGRDNDVE